ncbi:hypothetical protein TNCV_5078841 [Trichonephila clavipes]|nr:hypothetical protein TNCV_5078841 [Trichonephila clavipes]
MDKVEGMGVYRWKNIGSNRLRWYKLTETALAGNRLQCLERSSEKQVVQKFDVYRDSESHRNAESQMPLLRAMVQRSREKEQKQQPINGTENILLEVVQQLLEKVVSSRHGRTLNIRRAVSPHVRTEIRGPGQSLRCYSRKLGVKPSQNILPSAWFSKLRLMTGAHLAPSHDEFRGPRSDIVDQVA